MRRGLDILAEWCEQWSVWGDAFEKEGCEEI